MDLLKKAIDAYSSIISYEDLKRNKLTMADYHSLHCSLNNLRDTGKSREISDNVKNWFCKMGFETKMKNGVYIISIPNIV